MTKVTIVNKPKTVPLRTIENLDVFIYEDCLYVKHGVNLLNLSTFTSANINNKEIMVTPVNHIEIKIVS